MYVAMYICVLRDRGCNFCTEKIHTYNYYSYVIGFGSYVDCGKLGVCTGVGAGVGVIKVDNLYLDDKKAERKKDD